MDHLPTCEALSLAERFPDEPKPDHLSAYSWTEVKIVICDPACPVHLATVERGQELAREHGW